ncbi:helix-turn-helix domain-containing protein [Hymenobacter sp. YC55]|uniref:winged helix-turn-helix transcriptional regulator n=1 Tax=Hymenobacter sp. YC55 TaxID=3034019 RepID=UPI0023F8DB5D|nr:helix-turn-helix domain-containing protein [Hymenobacter sp. YC55]MDF7814031.1 helix-turn-helix domain-containing protein [Hymenobacter sp. YC55]
MFPPEKCEQAPEQHKERILALKDSLELLSGKWKFCILLNLYNYGTLRFKDLQQTSVGITPKVLSKELQELEENQLVTRTVNATKPVTVSYALTPHAIEIQPVINALIEFGLKHRTKIKNNWSQLANQ